MPEESTTTTTQGQGGTQDNAQNGQGFDYTTWLSSQSDEVKAGLAQNEKGLRDALQGERDQRKALADDLKKLRGTLDVNSDAAKQLGDVTQRMEAEAARADFYEKASAVGCRNLKLAWLAAQADNLTVEQVKAANPELFGSAAKPPTHAGAGAGGQGSGQQRDMNAFIRRGAGRGK